MRLSVKSLAVAAAIYLCQGIAGGQTLEPVVISVSRALQRSFDAPAAITSIDRDTIESTGPQGIPATTPDGQGQGSSVALNCRSREPVARPNSSSPFGAP